MTSFNKKTLSERDICSKFIQPALERAGWDLLTQIREEVPFTKGRVLVEGRVTERGTHKRADYLLYYKPELPIAIVEAKNNNHGVGDGMQQALTYAEMLDVPFVYSSNGDGFLEHDRTRMAGAVERAIGLDAFPTPEALWQRYTAWKQLNPQQQQLFTQDYYVDASGKQPHYYQRIAINRTIEAIARGQQRILLVMATGTGKTYTAFQIIWRLWKARAKRRILFLADRNILVDQTKSNDFKPFGSAMTKIARRQVDKSYEIYLSLYQAVSGNEAEKNIYKQFSRDFFDLVVVDECHRGSAAADSDWREILEYFGSATQIGLTATPKETRDISNTDYFGEPIYTYTLRQGIDDGFLAPYKVVRIDLDKDRQGWKPEPGQRDTYGQTIADREYNQQDFDRALVLEQRTQLVARKITEFLKATDRMAKTIVFCEDTNHAARMRTALVNENADLVRENRKYVMQVTANNQEGKDELQNFILPESRYPVIVTTSKLMSTGVDAQTCKLIVLDRNIESITEFKQIIGRGTRIKEEFGKLYFTIMDFRQATKLFHDPAFDGDPVEVYTPQADEPPVPPDERGDPEETRIIQRAPQPVKYVVGDVPVEVIAEEVHYYDAQGKPMMETLRDYTRNAILRTFASLDDFRQRWQAAEHKQALLHELRAQGVLLDGLAQQVGHELDPYDLIGLIAFDQPPLTRYERAMQVRQRNVFARHSQQARAVLDTLLDIYVEAGIGQIEDTNVLKLPAFQQIGTAIEIARLFGGPNTYRAAVRELARELYTAA